MKNANLPELTFNYDEYTFFATINDDANIKERQKTTRKKLLIIKEIKNNNQTYRIGIDLPAFGCRQAKVYYPIPLGINYLYSVRTELQTY